MLMTPVGLLHRLSLRRGLSIHGAGNRRRLCTQLRRLLRRLAQGDCHGSRQSRITQPVRVLNSPRAPRQMWCQCRVLRLFTGSPVPVPQLSLSWAQLLILATARDAQLLHAAAGVARGCSNGAGGSPGRGQGGGAEGNPPAGGAHPMLFLE